MSRPVPSPLPVEPSLRGVPGVEGILHAIAAEPGDDLHRLVLADLLEEHGHADRARFVRLACLEERWPGAATDELRALAEHHGETFRGGLHRRYLFGGGVIEGLEISGNSSFVPQMISQANDTVDIRRLLIGLQTVSRAFDGGAIAAALPGLTRLVTPYTHETEIGSLFWSLDSTLHPHLTHLSFAREEVRPEALTWIASGPTFPRLVALDLSEATLEEGTLELLLRSDTQERLTELTLFDAIFPTAELFGPNRLKRLAVAASNLRHAELTALVASPGVRGLRHLDLGDNYATDEVVTLLATAGPAELEYLNLRGNVFHANGATALAGSERLDSLRFLDLKGNLIGGTAARCVVRSRHLAGLELLDLSIAEVGAAVVAALAADSPLTRLQTLRLGGNDIGNDGAAALAGAAQLAGLRSLELYACGIGEAGALALAASPSLGGLTYLDARYNPLGERGKAAVLDRWPDAVV